MALSVYTPTGIVHETSVDFTKRVLAEPVHLVQYDASLPVLEVAMYDAGQYITLTASDTVSIRMDKGDGTFIYNPALGMSADGHTVYIQITLQMTVNYGRFEPVIELLRDGGYGASSPIPMFIDANPVPNEAIQSTSQWESLNDIVARANAIVAGDAVEFTEAETRTNISSGETLITMLGKIKKWFIDLGAAAFKAVANNLNTATAGQAVLDAYQGKILNDKVTNIGDARYKANTKTVTNGNYISITSVTIPANSGSWVILASIRGMQGDERIYLVDLIQDGSATGSLNGARTKATGGGGVCTWGFINTGNSNVDITLRTYGYAQEPYECYGAIYAFRIRH